MKNLTRIFTWLAVLTLCMSPAALVAQSTKSSGSSSSSKSKSSSSKGSKSSSGSDSKEKESASKKPASSDSKESKGSDSDDDSDDKSGAEDENETTETTPKPEPTPSILTTENLPGRLSSILSAHTKNSHWGVMVEVADTGQRLFELNAEEGFIPASNRKVFTGALALDQLGPDYVFRTFLYKTGTLDANGTLNGNLVIVPSGDPTFSKAMYKSAAPDWVFRDWAQKVKAAGIKEVKGDLLIDCSAWDMNDMDPHGWPDRMMNDSYAPQTSPLTINENITNIIVTPGKSGAPANISFAPSATGYPVENKTVSGKPGGPVARRISRSHIEVRGSVPEKKTIWSLPIDRPTLYAAANFRHHLMQGEIPIQGSVRIITAPGSLPRPTAENTIAMVQSPKLIEIVDYMMKRSDNHMAEQIYVAVSHGAMGKGSYSNSRRLEGDLLRRAQIDPAKVQASDGSGLSETNRITPSDMCKLLNYMRRHQYANQFYDSMAISGRDGTLRRRMGSITGRVHAKTGTINRVKTLSGYIALADGKTLSFSFLVNRISGGSPTPVHDRLCTTLAQLVLDATSSAVTAAQ